MDLLNEPPSWLLLIEQPVYYINLFNSVKLFGHQIHRQQELGVVVSNLVEWCQLSGEGLGPAVDLI